MILLVTTGQSASHYLIQFAYLVATALFIFSLKWMSDPKTARHGVFAGVGGMLLAVIGTLINPDLVNYTSIAIAVVIGTAIGVPLVVGAADRRPSADRAFARLWRLGGGPRRHGRSTTSGSRKGRTS